jgi:YVTN family beta-propeller protein
VATNTEGVPKGPGRKTWTLLFVVILGIIACVLLVLIAPQLKGCGSKATATATPTSTQQPSLTLAASPTTAAAQTPTLAPTQTPVVITAVPPTPGPTPTGVPLPECSVVFAGADGLNIRFGPGTRYDPPIAIVAKGTALRPLAYVAAGIPDGAWVLIQVIGTGVVGWVSAAPQYIACNVPVTSLPAGVPPPTSLPTSLPVPTCAPCQQQVTPIPVPTTPVPTRPVIQLPGAHPNGMVLDPVDGRLFVAGRDTNAVYAVDEKTLAVVGTIPVGKQPFGVAYMLGYVYVANFGSSSVSVIDAAALNVVTTISLSDFGSEPTFIATDPVRTMVYVALHGLGPRQQSYVVQIVPKLWRSTAFALVGLGAYGIASMPSLGVTFVSTRDSDTLVPIVPSARLAAIGAAGTPVSVPGSAYYVAAHWDNQRVYLTHQTKPGTGNPTALSLFQVNVNSDNNLFDSLSNIVRTVNVGNLGDAGGWVAVYPSVDSQWDGTVWVSANRQVQVFDADLTKQIRTYGGREGLGSDPFAIVFSPGFSRVYVGDGAGNVVNILSLR